MKATTLDITWWACRSSLLTQVMPSAAICQRSFSSISAAATLNLLWTRASSDFTTCRLPFSEWFSGSRSHTRSKPTVIATLHPSLLVRFLVPASRLLLRLLAQRRQVLRLLQPEVLQEPERRAVQVRPPGRRRPPYLRHQPASLQRRQHAVAVHAPDRLDGNARNRLLVGDDRQRFQRRVRQPVVFLQPQEPLDEWGRLRRRHHLHRRPRPLDADAPCPAVGRQRLDSRRNVFHLGLGQAGPRRPPHPPPRGG